VLEWNSAEYMR
jgi:hypothetical protein